MSDISDNELRRLDLTLLLVFLGLMRHRKSTDVARELGLTQSAISQALRRLRDIFGDELFLRRPHGLDPTAVALRLEPALARAVQALRGALADPAPFQPETTWRVIRLAALDAEQAVLLPGLIRDLAASAPGLQLSVRPLARREAMEALIAGEIDLALGFFWSAPDSLIAAPLYRQDFAVAGQAAVLGQGDLTPAAYAAFPHVLVSPAGDLRGIADEALAALGLERRVVAALPAFLPALAAAAEAPVAVTLPRALAEGFAPRFGLVTRAPPVALRSFAVTALRHRRNEHDPALLWLIDRLASAASSDNS
ncbi:LysR family transcriptional regulator [Neotabrizicola shimadae]|uniref:LysR family transcriptional regulator n=1 Tax=Neotabrizicola shimadae TaxID=2807096 RepID=A0A8G0ZXF3_9RHOB|nr:LysR family transcriptional regulator [Neotabrizicola shimadae]QYZ71210.1 LysR family transcriptional regulator [Neotabrizicola shimadae]